MTSCGGYTQPNVTSAEEMNTPLPTGECITQNQVTEDGEDVHSVNEPILNLKNYSSLNKVLTVTAWAKRFVGVNSNVRVTEENIGH